MSTISNWEQYRERYGSSVITVLPEDTELTNVFPYVNESMQPGAALNVPIETAMEQGVTFNNDGSGFALRDAIDSVIQMARLGGSEIALTGRIPYATAAQARNAGSSAGNRAFFSALELKQTNMAKAGSFYREILTWYGCGTAAAAAVNIGVVSAAISGTDLGTGSGLVVSITRASWNAALWMNLVPNAKVDIYESDGTTLVAAEVTVTARSESNNRLTFYKAGSTAVIDATDVIVMPGARTKQSYGVQALLQNTGSLHGIDAAATPVWLPITYSSTGNVTVAKLRAVGMRMSRNGANKGAIAMPGPEAFSDLCDELENDQQVNDDRSARVMGPDKIAVNSGCGRIEVRKSLYCKQGIIPVIANECGAKRVGAQELSMDVAGLKKFLETPVSGYAAYELRMYGQTAPFIEKMAHCAIMTGVTSTYDTQP
jgi:hypothetical protein